MPVSLPHLTPLFRLLAVCLALLPAAASLGKGEGAWALSPYRIQAVVAVESISVGADELAQQIAAHLGQRSDSAIGALWDLDVLIAQPGDVGTVLRLASGESQDFDALPPLQETDAEASTVAGARQEAARGGQRGRPRHPRLGDRVRRAPPPLGASGY